MNTFLILALVMAVYLVATWPSKYTRRKFQDSGALAYHRTTCALCRQGASCNIAKSWEGQ